MQLDVAAAEAVVALPNFAVALVNTLLGGDPETRKPVGGGRGREREGEREGKEGSR